MLLNEKTQLLPVEPDILDTFWTSIFPASVVAQHARDIRKLGILLHFLSWTRFFLFALPVRWLLWVFRFEPGFGSQMLFPLVAFLIGVEDAGAMGASMTCGMLHKVFVGANQSMWHSDAEAVLVIPITPIIVCLTTMPDASHH